MGNKTHHFLYLKLEIKSDFIQITGYSLLSLSDNDGDCVLSVYIYKSIDVFIEIVFNSQLNEIVNESKYILYIDSFGRFISTYH